MNREEINQEIAELKNKIAELEKKLEGKMEEGQWYYFVSFMTNKVECKPYRDTDYDKRNIEYGNVYSYTEEGQKQAERELFEFELMQKLKKFARENDEKIDWNNDDQIKWKIYYDSENNKLDIFWNNSAKEIQVYFTSAEIARKAIDEFKEELIKYFTEE